MYESFYGFREKPFDLTPDPNYFYMSQGHEEAYAHLEYAIMENKGFVVITGEIGSGKTTLLNLFLRKLKPDIEIAFISHTIVQPTQFLKMVCQEFDLAVNGKDKSQLIGMFYNFLLGKYSEKKRVALIVDESQNLSDRTLEEIRLLSNLESDKNHLIQIFLIGQPDLKIKLRKRHLEQLLQRVTVYWHLTSLSGDEVAQYINHRMWVAGAGNREIFDGDAVQAVYHYSGGLPRLVNILCDAALVHGFAEERSSIGKDVIEEVVKLRNIEDVFPGEKQSGRSSHERTANRANSPRLVQRMDYLETRINGLENMLGNLNKSIELLTSALGNFTTSEKKRDTMILELTQGLRNCMESRITLLHEINILKNTIQNENLKRPLVDEDDSSRTI